MTPPSRRSKEDCKMQCTYNEDSTFRQEADDFADFLAFVDREPENGGSSRGVEEFRSNWTKTENWREAMTLAQSGWAEGLQEVEKYRAQIESVTGSMIAKQVVQWDVSGDFADAGLYSSGVPECMGSFHEEIMPGAGRIVRIMIDVAAWGGDSAQGMIRRGAGAIALVDALEQSGRSCEVIACSTWGKECVTLVPVKRAGEALEIDRMAFMLAHPSMERRLMFSAAEQAPMNIRRQYGFRPGGPYGTPWKYSDPSADIIVPSPLAEMSESEIIAWIRAELQRQGCTMEETPA